MDRYRSLITPVPALRSDKNPGAFRHHSLPPRVAALLEGRHRELREQGDNATAELLVRLADNHAVTSLVHELNRRSRKTGNRLRPLMPALFWRDPDLRRLLRKHPQHARALPVFRWAARDENAARELCIAELLFGLAEMATQPDEWSKGEIDRHRRCFEAQRRAWRLLCADGLTDEAEPHLKLAIKHLVLMHILAQEWTPDRDRMLSATCRRLAGLFGFNGYRITAALVSAALDIPISRRHTRYAVRSFSE
jgi:hypothetical protein